MLLDLIDLSVCSVSHGLGEFGLRVNMALFLEGGHDVPLGHSRLLFHFCFEFSLANPF